MMRLATLLLLVSLLAGCDSSPPPAAPIRVDQAMGSEPAPGFARADTPRDFVFPADHGPHPDYATEWWYLTGNLAGADGRRFGYQFTLFRVGLVPGPPANDASWRTNQMYMGHVAISDIDGSQHHSAQRLGRAAAGLAGAQAAPLSVWLGPWQLQGEGDPFPLRLTADATEFALALELQAGNKPLVLQGERGLSRKGNAPGNASYYYSYTRLPTRGELRIGEQTFTVAGDSWLDREWSSSALEADQAGWDWFALQLDDGRELMYYQLRYQDGRAHPLSSGVLVAADGSSRRLTMMDVALEPRRHWRAPDGSSYPVSWRLTAPTVGLDLQVQAAFDDQLMDHAVRYWEGAVTVSGSHRGQGYLELTGYAPAVSGGAD
jgi:predicted secreted hydrolase